VATDVSVSILFHREGALALPALDSARDNVELARREGIALEARAILDGPDAITRDLVHQRGGWLDSIETVDFQDLGLSRNSACQSARGTFVAFLHGDALWGERWIADAYRSAVTDTSAIWHPEYLYHFSEDGFDHHSVTTTPHPSTGAHFSVQRSSDTPGFDPRSLIFANPWSADAFATRQVHLRFPYDAKNIEQGVGFEDWGWNIKTLWNDVPHLIVPATVHALRSNALSFSRRVALEGALPKFEV
jgi:hypothetical protein